MRASSAIRTSAIAALLASCTALDPTAFQAMHGTGEVVVIPGPGGGNGATGFGVTLLGFGTLLPDLASPSRLVRGSRYVASSGSGSVFGVYSVFDEQVVDARTTSGLIVTAGTTPRYTGCVAGVSCGAGSSISAAQTAIWHEDAATTRQACVIVPAGLAIVDQTAGTFHEEIQIRCEPSSSSIQSIAVPVERVNFGVSATSLPVEHPLGVALFGAPGDRRGNGAVYRLDDFPLNGFVQIDIAGPAGAGLGRTLASRALADGSILVAIGGRDRPNDPVVIVATLDPAGGVLRHACLRGRGTQFGAALAFGDFDADGVPDLAIGSGTATAEVAATQHGDLPIALYAGHALLAASSAGCEDPPSSTLAPARTLECASDAAAGFNCAAMAAQSYTGFGAALAIGDVNADGHDDLIVGAPFANVRAGGAGALIVLGGGATFDAIGATDHALLTYSSIMADAHLGASVSMVPGVDRMEIVAGAPGNGRVAVFFCSGIRGDRPEDFVNRSVTHGCVLSPTAGPLADAGPLPMDMGVAPIDAASVADSAMDAGLDASADASANGG